MSDVMGAGSRTGGNSGPYFESLLRLILVSFLLPPLLYVRGPRSRVQVASRRCKRPSAITRREEFARPTSTPSIFWAVRCRRDTERLLW